MRKIIAALLLLAALCGCENRSAGTSRIPGAGDIFLEEAQAKFKQEEIDRSIEKFMEIKTASQWLDKLERFCNGVLEADDLEDTAALRSKLHSLSLFLYADDLINRSCPHDHSQLTDKQNGQIENKTKELIKTITKSDQDRYKSILLRYSSEARERFF